MTDNAIIRYEDFVVGIANRTLRYKIKNKKAFALIFFDSFVSWIMRTLLLFVLAPFLVIPFLSFKYSWLLLFGFVGIFIGNVLHGINSRTRRPWKNMIELFLSFSLLLATLIYFIGFMQPVVFSFACLVYSFLFFDLSNNIYDEIATNRIVKNERLYYLAVQQEIIEVII